MLDPTGNYIIDYVTMNACSGLLESFTVEDITKTFKLCYAQTNAPVPYNNFVDYDGITFTIRNTRVESPGLPDYTIAGYEKTLYLDSGDYVASKVMFVHPDELCEESGNHEINGPYIVHNSSSLSCSILRWWREVWRRCVCA